MGVTSWLWGSSPAPAAEPAPPAPAAITPPPPPPAAEPTPEPTTPAAPPLTELQRITKQLTLPLFGTAFLLLSLKLTRRSVVRRLAPPPFFHQSNHPPPVPVSGAFDAFEALQLASLNVVSFAMLLIGSGAFMLDVCNVGELREKLREKMEMGEDKEEARKAEEEFEEWMVEVLARKEVKERVQGRVMEKVGEFERGKGQ